MNSILVLAFALLVPSLIALLALRYGADSRPEYRSSEHILAGHGVTWEDAQVLPPAIVQEPRIRLVSSDQPSAYPPLVQIDGA